MAKNVVVKKKKKNKRAIQVMVVVAVLVVAMLVPTLIGLRNNQDGGFSLVKTSKEARDRINRLSKVVVATVNSVKITQLDFERDVDAEYTELLRRGNARLDQKDSLRANILERLIRDALILDAANKAGYTLSNTEVQNLVWQDKSQYYDEDEWSTFLNNWDFTEELYAEHVKNQEIISQYPLQAIGEIVVTEEEILADYEERLKNTPDLVLEDIRSNIVMMISYTKQADTYQSWEENLRNNATITYNEPRSQGYIAMVKEDYVEAEAQYRKAMSALPNDPYIPLNLGLVLIKAGDVNGGFEMIEKAIEIEPVDPYISLVHGQVLFEQGYVEEARIALLRASEIATDDIGAHSDIRQAFNVFGFVEEYEAEQELIRQILAINNQNFQQSMGQ